MTKHTCKRHQAPTAPEPDGFAQWWAQWPSRTVAAGRRAHYAEAYDARTEEIELLRSSIARACAGYPENDTAPTCVAILRSALGNVGAKAPT